MSKGKQHCETVQVEHFEKWLKEAEVDQKTEQLIIKPTELCNISKELASKLTKYKLLGQITLDGCYINHLQGLPKLPCLMSLNLRDNR